MFCAFDVRGVGVDVSFEAVGLQNYNQGRRQVLEALEEFVGEDGSIDGTRLQDSWFPQIQADVFLSHSHGDEALALRLAGWLWQRFRLRVFVDSCVWGCSAELLKRIDNKYCRIPGQESYSYEKRSLSTSHVHMMLSTALAKMIDRAECAWVLNTGNSITTREAIDSTKSPWIFSEIAMMHVVRRRDPRDHRDMTKLAKAQREGLERPLVITYNVDLRGFEPISQDIIVRWSMAQKVPADVGTHPLDLLYRFYPKLAQGAP